MTPDLAGNLAGLRAASATLGRATAFLGGGLCTGKESPALPLAIAGPYRAKVIGNGLRELDRFLNLLADQVARLTAPADFDLAAFARQRNTANKLRTIGATASHADRRARLRAIGRSRDCLFHCGGIVRRGDGRHDRRMTAGWPATGDASDAPPLRLPLGEKLLVSAIDLQRVCQFYDRLATDLTQETIAYLGRDCFFGRERL